MSVNHYENFPIASVLLPARIRKPVELIYRFARAADDFADEGELADGEARFILDSVDGQWRRFRLLACSR